MDSLSSLFPALRTLQLASSDAQVHLRSWRATDADFLLTSFADDQARLCTPLPGPINHDIALRWIHDHSARGLRPTSPALLITNAEGVRCGAIGATRIDWKQKQAQFFYWVLAPYRHHGLATVALRTISEWAFTQGLSRLELMIDTNNPISIKVAISAGYSFECLHPGYRFLNSKFIDAVAYTRSA